MNERRKNASAKSRPAGLAVRGKLNDVKTRWNYFFDNKKGKLAWLDGRKAATIMAVVVALFIAMPIVVVSAAHGFERQAVEQAVSAEQSKSNAGTTDNLSAAKSAGGANTAANTDAAGSSRLMTSDGEIVDKDGNVINDTLASTQSTPMETTSSEATTKSEASTSFEPTDNTLKLGMTSERVAKVQQRLMDLGYMDDDEPTNYFGPATKNAVQLFQRKNSLDIDGCVGDTTWNLLFSDKAAKYTVSEGITGTDVEQLQQRLVDLGYLGSVTGYFGSDTTEAVKRFQEKNDLTADGNIGEKTKEMLYSDNAAVNTVDYGEQSDKIKTYQDRLVKLGYLTQSTGLYGAETVQAVRRFQEKNGLISDGALGPTTIAAIMSQDAQANALTVTTSGSDVEKVQNRLIKLGYLSGSATGYYGTVTEDAVSAFQTRNGLTADGKVGAQTNSVLFSDDAKAAATTASSGDSSSTDKKTDTTTDKKTDTTTDKKTDTSTDKKTDTSTDKKTDTSTDKKTDTSTDKKTDTSTDKKTDTSTDKKTDTSTDKKTDTSDDTPSSADSKSVSSLISVAKSRLGSNYVRGAKGPNQFDCSGFVYWCLNQIGVKQGYMTSAGWRASDKYPTVKSMNDLERGDIVSFVGHVGIYLGNGQMIDASSSEGEIRICSNIQSSSYWRSHFVKGCRVL